MIILRIYRSPHHYDVNQLDLPPNTKLLTLFEHIRTNIDPTFQFTSQCKHGICGSCAVKVNGVPVLACKMEIGHFNGGVLKIEPLNEEMPKVDLLSDFSDFYRSFEFFPDFLEFRNMPLKENCEALGEPCHQCGICFYSCPAVPHDENFCGPAAALKNYRFLCDPRDNLQRTRLEKAAENIYGCVKCGRCEEFCPRSLGPFKAIEKTRRQCLTLPQDSVGITHTKALFDSIYHYGRINELFTAQYLFGFFKTLSLVKKFLPFLWKGRISLKTSRSKKIEEIRQLLEMEDSE